MKSLRAIVVDDSIEHRMLLSKILQKAFEINVIEASDGQDALSKIVFEKPDIVFLDYEMPVMNGKETLKALRSEPELANTPVIMVSAHHDSEIVRELLGYNIMGYLIKPFSAKDVVRRVLSIFPKAILKT